MSMHHTLTLPTSHPHKSILAITFNPLRRELYTAAEDGKIRVFGEEEQEESGGNGESTNLKMTLKGHEGWVTAILFCKDLKVLFSASVDGVLIVWSVAGKMLQKIETLSPIYSLAYCPRRPSLLAGFNSKIASYPILSNEEMTLALATTGTTDVLNKVPVLSKEHTDIVKCLGSGDTRFFSAGYDRKIVIYQAAAKLDNQIKVMLVIPDAHEAAITSMVHGRDADSQWLITGSYDRVVKVWSVEGNLLHRFDGFPETISTICYIPPMQALWISANSPSPLIFDPRTGIEVTLFVSTEFEGKMKRKATIKHLLYIPESNEVIAVTSKRDIMIFKYDPSAAMTTLHCADSVESICFTKKEPLLVFSGQSNGLIRRWERLQLNTYMYASDILIYPAEALPVISPSLSRINRRRLYAVAAPTSTERARQSELMTLKTQGNFNRKERALEHQAKRMGVAMESYLASDARLREEAYEELRNNSGMKATSADDVNDEIVEDRVAVFTCIWHDATETLFTGREDGRIDVWSYVEETAADLGLPVGETKKNKSRTTGLTLRVSFQKHEEAVTGLIPFSHRVGTGPELPYLISTSTDRHIYIYNLTNGKYCSAFHNPLLTHNAEIAADGPITSADVAYDLKEFAYASSDKCVYVRTMSNKGENMSLRMVLIGHEAEVTRVRLCKVSKRWVTVSEDGCVRFWSMENPICLKIIRTGVSIISMTCDELNGCILIATVDGLVKIVDPAQGDGEIVGKLEGHTDVIKDMIHIPDRRQYLTASSDGTIKVWNAYFKKGQRKWHALVSNADEDVEIATDDLKRRTAIAVEVDEAAPSYSELNPIVTPRILLRGGVNSMREFPADESFKEEPLPLSTNKADQELLDTLKNLEIRLAVKRVDGKSKGRPSRLSGLAQSGVRLPAAGG